MGRIPRLILHRAAEFWRRRMADRSLLGIDHGLLIRDLDPQLHLKDWASAAAGVEPNAVPG